MFIGAFSELSYDARSLRASIGRAGHARVVARAVLVPLELPVLGQATVNDHAVL